jgi:PAS domain S-box-containing protein
MLTPPSLRRIVWAFAVLLAMLSLIGVAFLIAADRTVADLRWLGVDRWQLIRLAMQAQELSLSNSRLTTSIVLIEDEKEVDKLAAARAENSRRISELIRQVAPLLAQQDEKALYAEFLRRREIYLTAHQEALRLYRDDHTRGEARALMAAQTAPLLAAYHKAWNELIALESKRMDEFVGMALQRSQAWKRHTLLLLLATSGLAVAVAVLTVRRQRTEELKRHAAERALEKSHAALKAKVEARTAEAESATAALRETNHELVAIMDANERTNLDLLAKEALLRKLILAVEQAAESIVITDTAGCIEFVNPAFEERTGYSVSEVLRRNPRLLKSGHHTRGFYQDLWRTLQDGGVWSGRLVNRKKDGTLFHEDATISPVRENGAIIGYVAVKRDVTREVALEQQLLQAQKLEAIGRLAAGIAHEINTPTQFVADNTHFLKDSFAEIVPLLAATPADALGTADLPFLQAEIPKAIDQSLEGLERISKIVGAMKDFSHPGTEDLKPADLNRALDGTITVSRGEWKRVAKMVTQFCPDLPAVPVVLNEINQVFLVLIVNAAHAIEEAAAKSGGREGVITIQTLLKDDHAEVRISDNGAGIPISVMPRIFEPFFTTKPVGKGTGQGLSLARSIVVERHHGRLEFESQEGAGTTFIVRLPLVAPPKQEGVSA